MTAVRRPCSFWPRNAKVPRTPTLRTKAGSTSALATLTAHRNDGRALAHRASHASPAPQQRSVPGYVEDSSPTPAPPSFKTLPRRFVGKESRPFGETHSHQQR